MLISFFNGLRNAEIPVTLRELMDLIEALQHRLVFGVPRDIPTSKSSCMLSDVPCLSQK